MTSQPQHPSDAMASLLLSSIHALTSVRRWIADGDGSLLLMTKDEK
jgi:hypothetical protein